VDSLVQRDVRDLSRVDSLDALPRLLQVAAGQTSRILNVSELSAPFQLSRPTIRTYLTLLERVFLVDILPPWHNNRLSRLIKTPKIHMGDPGLAAALLGADAPALLKDRPLLGQLLETMVVQELRRLASWHPEHHDFHHFRDKEGNEVDVVLERGAHALAGVEVKASSTVTSADFKGMRILKEGAGKRFQAGVVLYDGDKVLRFGENMFAVPLTALWEE
jgi:predicted AAA+ superfamily ATPase